MAHLGVDWSWIGIRSFTMRAQLQPHLGPRRQVPGQEVKTILLRQNYQQQQQFVTLTSITINSTHFFNTCTYISDRKRTWLSCCNFCQSREMIHCFYCLIIIPLGPPTAISSAREKMSLLLLDTTCQGVKSLMDIEESLPQLRGRLDLVPHHPSAKSTQFLQTTQVPFLVLCAPMPLLNN